MKADLLFLARFILSGPSSETRHTKLTLAGVTQ